MTPQEIRDFLDRMGWSQAQLAIKLGVHSQTVSNWVCGDNDPPVYLRLALLAIWHRLDEDWK